MLQVLGVWPQDMASFGGLKWPQLCKSRGWVMQVFWEDLERSLNKSPALETYQSSLAGGGCLCQKKC